MKAYNIIEKYFSDEDEEGGEQAGFAGPTVGQDGTFGFGTQPQQQTNFQLRQRQRLHGHVDVAEMTTQSSSRQGDHALELA